MENVVITYKDGSLTELEAIKKISEGEKLNAFTPQTKLMCLALVTYQKGSYKQIPEMYWNKRLAALAVNKDFRALAVIPKMFYPSCVAEFALWGNKMTAEDEKEWVTLFNEQSERFMKGVVKRCPRLERFIDEEKKTASIEMVSRENEFKKPVKRVKVPKFPEESFEMLFQEDRDVMDPESFFSLNIKYKTIDRLSQIVESDALFPADFIERLSLPNKNAYYYRQAGNTEMEEYWNRQKLPYLNRDICMKIACKHPEGAITTAPYITKEAVQDFFYRNSSVLSKAELTDYFLSFPPGTLDGSMAKYVRMSWQVLAHAPEALCNTEEADRYLKRFPWDILRLPECYQTEDRLITAGVKLSGKNLQYIRNAEMREKIALALNIGKKNK